MRIVARKTADSCVVDVVTLATGQAIGLEADVGDARVGLHSNFRPSAMALSTEVRYLLGRELVWLGFFFVLVQVVAVEQRGR